MHYSQGCREPTNENKQFSNTKTWITVGSDRASKGTVVNRTCHFINGGSLENTCTVPLRIKFTPGLRDWSGKTRKPGIKTRV